MSLQKRRIEEALDRRKLTNQMRASGKGLGNLPFELSLESISETERFQRSQDKEALAQFNKDVEDWTEQSKQALRASIKSLVKRDVYLSDSLKGNVYKYKREVNRVGFSFAREGIYIHKGAGRGQGGVIGGRWIDRYGSLKFRDSSSAGLQGTGNRRPILWFDPVITNRLDQLADIVADYSATMQVDATNIYIDDRP